MRSAKLGGMVLALVAGVLWSSALQAQGVPTSQPAVQGPADDPLPDKPGTYRLACYPAVDGQTLRIPYVLYIPDNYRPDGRAPVLVFLHGLGERGTDLDGIFLHGPNFELTKDDREGFRHAFPFVVISPQCPPRGQRWDDNLMPRYVHAVLDRLLPRLSHDPQRVCLTGFSMGGLGAWKVATLDPSRFAGLVTVSAQPWQPADSGPRLKTLSTLSVLGSGDTAAVDGGHAMAAAINAAGGSARTIEGPGGHGIWVPAYANCQLYEWLLVQRQGRPNPPAGLAISATAPARGGFFRRSIPVEILGQQLAMDCQVYVPPSLRPGQKVPAIVYLHDDRTIGVEKEGQIYRGPAAEVLRGGGASGSPVILITPQLPPVIGHWDNSAVQAALSQAVDDALASLPIDPQRLYVCGADAGARGATMLSRQKAGRFAAEAAIMSHPRVAIGDLRGDWLHGQRVRIILAKKFEPWRMDQLQQFIQLAGPGSSITVFPAGCKSPDEFVATPAFYDAVLK